MKNLIIVLVLIASFGCSTSKNVGKSNLNIKFRDNNTKLSSDKGKLYTKENSAFLKGNNGLTYTIHSSLNDELKEDDYKIEK